MTVARCAGCGLNIEGGTEGCQRLFEELVGRDFSDVRYGRLHGMLVDTYCLQHPDRYCVSGKSLAAHLCGLCLIMERGGSRAQPHEPLRRWLDGPKKLDKPRLPARRGSITIAAIRDADGPEAHAVALDRWAKDVWAAYSTVHEQARTWLDAATSGH